jgi:resuscitation-promoting factor RpfB
MARGSGLNGPAIAAIAAGGLVLYSAVTNRGFSQGFQALVSGKSPSTAPVNPSILSSSGAGAGPEQPGQLGGTKTQNLRIGQMLASARGWGSGAEWSALVALWTRESNWNNTAKNPSSGAYGIPQALPASKMPPSALPPTNSARDQITWGLDYIAESYGTPSAAWAHEQQFGWY